MTPKKKLILSNIIVQCVLIFAVLLPIYQIPAKGETPVHFGMLWDYMAILDTPNFVVSCLGFALALIVFLLGLSKLIKSFKAKPEVGDIEDKNFVIGSFLSAVPQLIYALFGLTWAAYFLSIIGILTALFSIFLIYIHYKKFSDI